MKISVTTMAAGNRDDRPGRWSETRTESKSTTVNYKETPTTLVLRIDMPGADAAGLDLTLKGRRLTIRHEKKSESRSQDERSERVETLREVLSKEIELPADVDAETGEAVFKNGVLTVTLTKLGARS
jgi:HSP20 family protein